MLTTLGNIFSGVHYRQELTDPEQIYWLGGYSNPRNKQNAAAHSKPVPIKITSHPTEMYILTVVYLDQKFQPNGRTLRLHRNGYNKNFILHVSEDKKEVINAYNSDVENSVTNIEAEINKLAKLREKVLNLKL